MTGEKAVALSLVEGDPAYRLQRALHLIPASGLGVGRRAIIFALLTWLPVAAWAALRGRAVAGALDEPLLQHFGVTIRCLVAIPLLILAEQHVHRMGGRLLAGLYSAGIGDPARIDPVLAQWRELRGRTAPWVILGGLVIAWSVLASFTDQSHELQWAVEEPLTQRRGFGGWWYLIVARPIYIALVLAWLWRLCLLTLLMFRLSRSGLSLVPTHPDRLGGLRLLRGLPAGFSLVGLSLSAVLASTWAHNVVYHDVPVRSLAVNAAIFLCLLVVLFLTPVLVFAPLLVSTRARALAEYGDLIARHGRGVRTKWIEGHPVDDALLAAPEVGPVADTVSMYDAVRKMRPIPAGIVSVMAILLPAVVPMLVVWALQVPVSQILKQLMGIMRALV